MKQTLIILTIALCHSLSLAAAPSVIDDICADTAQRAKTETRQKKAELAECLADAEKDVQLRGHCRDLAEHIEFLKNKPATLFTNYVDVDRAHSLQVNCKKKKLVAHELIRSLSPGREWVTIETDVTDFNFVVSRALSEKRIEFSLTTPRGITSYKLILETNGNQLVFFTGNSDNLGEWVLGIKSGTVNFGSGRGDLEFDQASGGIRPSLFYTADQLPTTSSDYYDETFKHKQRSFNEVFRALEKMSNCQIALR